MLRHTALLFEADSTRGGKGGREGGGGEESRFSGYATKAHSRQ